MAHSAEGARLTAEHRAAQMGLAAQLSVWLSDLFRQMLDPADIDLSTARFVKVAAPVVAEARQVSWSASIDYLEEFRRAELKEVLHVDDYLGDADAGVVAGTPNRIPTPDIAAILDRLEADRVAREAAYDAAAAALDPPEKVAADLATSSGAVMKAEIKRGRTTSQAEDTAAGAVAAKTVKIVLSGGRAVTAEEVRRGGSGCVGYARVVDADPCPFCAMLASRGGVYRSDAFAESNTLFAGDGAFMVHDGCGCTMEPIYGHPLQNLPPGSEDLAAEWAEIAAGRPDPWGHWRRWRESGTRPGEERADVRERLEGDHFGLPTSAPKGGRVERPKKGRKQIEDMTLEEVRRTLDGMYVRRAGLQKDLARLAAAGQTPDQPGPAQKIADQLERTQRNIDKAEARLS